MGKILLEVDETVLPNLAKTIMAKTGKSEPLTLYQFAAEVEGIEIGSALVLQELTVTKNGEYVAAEGYDGLSKVTVDIKSEDSSSMDKFFIIEPLHFHEITMANDSLTIE